MFFSPVSRTSGQYLQLLCSFPLACSDLQSPVSPNILAFLLPRDSAMEVLQFRYVRVTQ